MPTNVFTSDRYLLLNGFHVSNGYARWRGELDTPGVISAWDHNDDGNLDSTGTPDYIGATYNHYSGWTVNINGHDYAIFINTYFTSEGTAYIPYDSTFDHLGELLPFPRHTNQRVENGVAQNFCFVAGTGIATPLGEVAVERLRIGDTILTADRRAVAVKWVGYQTVRPVFGLMNEGIVPVRIRAGALGNGSPHVDLTVSADHGMVLDGMVINASALVNGTTITFVPVAEFGGAFKYFHVETEDHDVILANGAAAETFVDHAGRQAFDNCQEYLDLYGAGRIIPSMDRPRISSRRLVPDAIKVRLGIVGPETDRKALLSA